MAAAAAETTPASWQLGQINKRSGKLLGTLGKARAARACDEKRPGVEFTVVVLWRTVAARSPWRHARRRVGSIYKRSCIGEGFMTTRTDIKGKCMGTKGSTAGRGMALTP
jgi:hypothetical protein